MSKSQKIDIARLEYDLPYFNFLILPNMFFLEPASIHAPLYAALGADVLKLLAVIYPRGWGKTSILQAYVIHEILYRKHPLILYVSESLPQARIHTETIKEELETNPIIQQLYGDQVGKRRWSKDLWTTRHGISVMPRGAETGIRGVKVGSSRPSCIVIDDPESEDDVVTQEGREKFWNKYYTAIKPMIQRGAKKTRVVLLGTRLGEYCFIERMQELMTQPPYLGDKTICCLNQSAEDVDGQSTWESLFSTNDLQAERAEYAKAGLLSSFYLEYLGKPLAGRTGIGVKDIDFYQIDDLGSGSNIRIYGSLDLAFSKRKTADYSSFIVGAHLRTSTENNLYIKEAVRLRGTPSEVIAELVRLNELHKPRSWFIQNATLDQFFAFFADASTYGLPFVPIPIKNAAKGLRLANLEPLIRAKRIKLLKGQAALTGELVGADPHDDLRDALATLAGQLPLQMRRPVTQLLADKKRYKQSNDVTGYCYQGE